MASYYYLLSSLPTLKTDAGMPLSYREFLDMCSTSVSPSVYAVLSELSAGSGGSSANSSTGFSAQSFTGSFAESLADGGSFLRLWGEFYRKLNGRLNAHRREKLGKPAVVPDAGDASGSFRIPSITEQGGDSIIEKAVNGALNASDPLAAERVLLDAQFDYLDSLMSMHYFDTDVLYGYAVKLKLLERQSAFVRDEGKEEFRRLFTGIQKQIEDM